ncbi:MAG: PfkB family carbohydrate kinase, partial [Anaerolineae bacterium]
DKAPINRDKAKVYWGKARPTLAVDRVGSGDAHMAGFLYGYLTEGIEKGLAYASAMASLKRTIPGDLAIVTKEEVEALLEEEDSRIRR